MFARIKPYIHQLLRKSEKYTKTDMVYLAKGSFWMSFGQIISSGAAFATAIMFANLISKHDFGIYKYALSVAGILGAFTLHGFSAAIPQSVSRGYEKVISKSFIENIKWHSFFFFGGIVVAGYYYYKQNSILASLILIIAILQPFLSSLNIFSYYLNGKKLFKENMFYTVVKNCLLFICLLLVTLVSKNIIYILLTYFLAQILVSYFFHRKVIKTVPINSKEDTQVIENAKHFSFINILSVIANHIDKILIFQFLGSAELAIYLFAIAVPEQMRGFTKQIGVLALPKFAVSETAEIKKTMQGKIIKFSLLIIFIILFYILIAPLIYKIIFPQYLDSILYSQIFSISLLGAVAVLPLSALQAKLAKKDLYKLTTISSVLQLIFIFSGIYFYGLMGLIIAKVTFRLINLLLTYLLFQRSN